MPAVLDSSLAPAGQHVVSVGGYGQYRTPIANLYLCGAGTPPGGGVTGAPGYNAAREVLKDVETFHSKPERRK